MKAALASGLETFPAIMVSSALATAIAAGSAVTPATVAVAVGGLAVHPAAKALLFAAAVGRALPAGAFFAAEYAAFLTAKRHVCTTGVLSEAFAETPLGRFAVGAASITALCAIAAPARAVPMLAAAGAGQVGGSAATTAAMSTLGTVVAQMVAMTRSKAAWFGTFEGLKTFAHGPQWDGANAANTANSSATTAVSTVVATAAATAASDRVEKDAANRRVGATAGQQRTANRGNRAVAWRRMKVDSPRLSARSMAGHHRARALRMPLKNVMTRLFV